MSHHLWLFVLKSILTYFGGQQTGDRGTLKLILLSSDWKLEGGLVSGEVTCQGDSQQMMTGTRTRSDKLWLHATILKGPNQPPIMYNKTIKITIKVQGR